MTISNIQRILQCTPQLRYVVHRARSTPPNRPFSSTPNLLVRRPMEKYEYAVPAHDEWGHPISKDKPDDHEAPYDETAKFLRELADPKQVSWTEKYGSHDGFGLKNRKRYIKGPDGQLIPWDAAGDEWRLATGYHNRQMRGEWRARLPGTAPIRPRIQAPSAYLRGGIYESSRRAQVASKSTEYLDNDNPNETPLIETPVDIVKLNLDALEAEYKRVAESGMFVKRKTRVQLQKEKKYLERRMRREESERLEREAKEAKELAASEAPMTPWEEDVDNDQINVDAEEISALPPSERKQHDPRIGRGPTFGAEPVAPRSPRVAWGARSDEETGAAPVGDVENDYESRGSTPTSDTPYSHPSTNPLRSRVRAMDPSTPPPAGRNGSFGLRRYSTMRMQRPDSKSSPPTRPSARTATSTKLDFQDTRSRRRAITVAYREQVAATFVPNRRRKLLKEGVTTETGAVGRESTAATDVEADQPVKRPWQPTKKLTFDAMDGLRALHRAEPEVWTVPALSKKFGISWEAVNRILKSRWREKATAVKREQEKKLEGTKWGKDPSASSVIDRVYAKRKQMKQSEGHGVLE